VSWSRSQGAEGRKCFFEITRPRPIGGCASRRTNQFARGRIKKEKGQKTRDRGTPKKYYMKNLGRGEYTSAKNQHVENVGEQRLGWRRKDGRTRGERKYRNRKAREGYQSKNVLFVSREPGTFCPMTQGIKKVGPLRNDVATREVRQMDPRNRSEGNAKKNLRK